LAAWEVTEEMSGARAGTSGLIQLGGAFDYRAMRDLVVRGIPAGPPGMPVEELPDDELDDFDSEEAYDYQDEPAEEDELDPDPDEPKYRATPKAVDMIVVVFALRRWLETRPGGPHPDPTSDPHAGAAIVSLICGWSATLTHALAREPLSVAELDRAVEIVDRETLEEILEGMEHSGQVEPLPGQGETRYALTEWGRNGIAPLVAATLYERLHPADYALPPDVLDAEAAFQMALPLLELPAGLSGRCRLGVWIPGSEPSMAGATAEVGGGRVISSTPLLDESPETWVTGLPLHWCEAVIDPSVAAKLRSGGDTELTGALLQASHERLFGETGA
jgi:DNA-binding HxlR family transcriptional regulator